MRQQHREARWYRSMLFVPGHKPDWMAKAPKYGADAYIYDLEDSVAIEQKAEAREHVATAIGGLKGERFGRFVRLNGWRTGKTIQDLLQVVREGLDGVLLSKTEDAEDVMALDLVLTDLEMDRDLPVGRIEIVALLETARAMHRHFEICSSSERIRRSSGGGGDVSGGDGARALGIRPLGNMGDEALTLHGQSGLEARAAGVTQILGGMTSKIDDLDLVRRLAVRAKSLGASGSMSIHPSHVPIHNEVFAPSPEEISEAHATLAAMAAAIARGDAAVRLNGKMVDYAHVRSSFELLTQAQSVGIDVGTIPDLPVLSFEGA